MSQYTNKDQIKKLKSGVNPWNRWRKKYNYICINISGGDFSGMDLTGCNLDNVTMNNTNFTNCILDKSTIKNSSCIESNFTGASIKESVLFCSNFNVDRVSKRGYIVFRSLNERNYSNPRHNKHLKTRRYYRRNNNPRQIYWSLRRCTIFNKRMVKK